jgi:hypothetical protein
MPSAAKQIRERHCLTPTLVSQWSLILIYVLCYLSDSRRSRKSLCQKSAPLLKSFPLLFDAKQRKRERAWMATASSTYLDSKAVAVKVIEAAPNGAVNCSAITFSSAIKHQDRSMLKCKPLQLRFGERCLTFFGFVIDTEKLIRKNS